jgi:hypothetical protein
MMTAHREQIRIARDDQRRSRRDRSSDDMIVIGVAGHYAGHVYWIDQLDGLT